MFKKIIVFALALTLSVGMLFSLTLFASAETPAYDGGSGTEADPYIISTEASLKALAAEVNGGANQAGVYFKLSADITLTEAWTPIGLFDDSPEGTENDIDTPFSGNFNGMGHEIKGLNITSTDKASIGLFGSIGEGTVIKNVTVSGTITGTARFLGSVVGITGLNSTIQNCVSNVVINAKAAGSTPRIGGIVGNMREGTKVEYCVNNGAVTITEADGTFVEGGIAGDIGKNGVIKYCINNADIEAKNIGTAYVGGIVARVAGEGATVSDCAAKGNLTANSGITTGCIGGIVSYINSTNFTVTNSGYIGTITSPTPAYYGYISGNTKNVATITNCKVSGDVLFGTKYASKVTPVDCVASVANIDDIELAVKTAISEWVKVELPAAPEIPENPPTSDTVITAVVVAVLSAFGMATVVYFKKNRANAL